MEAVEAVPQVEKKDRRNVMKSIRRRLNSGAYNKTRNLKRNERNVREKLRSFEKKGELKGYMLKRYDDALDLLGRLEEIKEVGANVLPAKEPEPEPKKKFTVRRRLKNALNYAAAANAAAVIPAAAANAVPALNAVPAAAANAVPAAPPMTLKKRRKKLEAVEAPYVAPEFNPPPANLPAMPLVRGEYNREGNFHVRGEARSNAEVPLEGAPENIGRFGYVPKEKGPREAKLPKKTRLLTEEEMKYLERVYKSFLPLPELYNPYTGVKYGPDEDPQDNIDSAHYMLLEIQEKAKRKALALKRREEKTMARAGV